MSALPPLTSSASLAEHLPYPIAASWAEVLLHGEGSVERREALVKCFLMLQKTMVALALADYMVGARDKELDDTLKKFIGKPSHGIWLQFWILLIKHLQQREQQGTSRVFLREAYEWHHGKNTKTGNNINDFIRIRNEISHKPWLHPSPKETCRVLEEALRSVLGSLGWMGGYSLVRVCPGAQPTSHGTTRGRLQYFQGDKFKVPPRKCEWRGYLGMDDVYLIHHESHETLLLSPWIRICESLSQEEMFVLDSIHDWNKIILSPVNAGPHFEVIPSDLYLKARQKAHSFQDWWEGCDRNHHRQTLELLSGSQDSPKSPLQAAPGESRRAPPPSPFQAPQAPPTPSAPHQPASESPKPAAPPTPATPAVPAGRAAPPAPSVVVDLGPATPGALKALEAPSARPAQPKTRGRWWWRLFMGAALLLCVGCVGSLAVGAVGVSQLSAALGLGKERPKSAPSSPKATESEAVLEKTPKALNFKKHKDLEPKRASTPPPKEPSQTSAPPAKEPSQARAPSTQSATTSNSAGMELRQIPAGSFLRSEKSQNRHWIEITRPFWIQTTEVTVSQWKAVMGKDPSFMGSCGASCPVELVSWYDAVLFANKLSEREGLTPCYELSGCNSEAYATLGCSKADADHDRGGWCGQRKDGTRNSSYNLECSSVHWRSWTCSGYRLPTEAEWEYAARAGSTAPYYGDLPDIAWFGAWSDGDQTCPDGAKHPVKRKLPNAWGLYDVLGNVAEWVWDIYEPYQENDLQDPVGSSSGAARVFRGGSECHVNEDDLRLDTRKAANPINRSRAVGFRLARTSAR